MVDVYTFLPMKRELSLEVTRLRHLSCLDLKLPLNNLPPTLAAPARVCKHLLCYKNIFVIISKYESSSNTFIRMTN